MNAASKMKIETKRWRGCEHQKQSLVGFGELMEMKITESKTKPLSGAFLLPMILAA